MLHYALEDKLLHVLCCCSDGIIDVQDSITSMWCPDDFVTLWSCMLYGTILQKI